ncbi:enoyl-CoA hydratase-related protein [Aeromicrobium sp. UC242_57]|uniref:enoyl-CoA hydratase-related protein n=1 Tax=Aeromicrobium sp. UC242_57 TaxID=3374624 RepID=UPI00378746B8
MLRSYDGDVVIEASTVPYDRDGAPEAVVLSTLTPDGDRVLVRTDDPQVLALALDGDPLGRTVRLATGTVRLVRGKAAELLPPETAPVRSERRGALALVTLDRPEVRNAIDGRTAAALEQAIDDAEADDRVRVIVLTGAGGTFCAGMDLKAAARGRLARLRATWPLGVDGATADQAVDRRGRRQRLGWRM